MTVVADQHGCPTSAADLAAAILQGRRSTEPHGLAPGVSKASSTPPATAETTWYGLAVATFEEAARHGVPIPEVVPIAAADWPTPAKRPANSRLDCTRLRKVFDVALPAWRPSLAATIDAIFATQSQSKGLE